MSESYPSWIPVSERMPEIDYSAAMYKWHKNVIGAWDGGVAEVKYAANGYAKTEKGKAPRYHPAGAAAFLFEGKK